MFAQILTFEKRPAKEVEYDIAAAIGDFTHNIKRLGARLTITHASRDGQYLCTAQCILMGQTRAAFGISTLGPDRAQLDALEQLHGKMTEIQLFRNAPKDIA